MEMKQDKMKLLTRECLRCGLCCMGRGDLAFGDDDVSWEEHVPCPGLTFNNGIAECEIYDNRRDCCEEYPFPDMDNGLCERQLRALSVLRQFSGKF